MLASRCVSRAYLRHGPRHGSRRGLNPASHRERHRPRAARRGDGRQRDGRQRDGRQARPAPLHLRKPIRDDSALHEAGASILRGILLRDTRPMGGSASERSVMSTVITGKQVMNLTPECIRRFWSYVRTSDECWEWQACKSRGYGRFGAGPTSTPRVWFAHRIAYQLCVGPIPEGLEIDHLCRNRGCVNPSHLETVTGRVNTLRGVSKAAINAQKTHCIHGHALDEDNLYVWHNQRRCMTCRRAVLRRYYDRYIKGPGARQRTREGKAAARAATNKNSQTSEVL